MPDRKEKELEPEKDGLGDWPLKQERNNERPGRDKLFERMKRVDPKQSEKYKQRTGE